MSWPVAKIEDIFEVARGGSPRPIQEFITDDPDGVNWIMIGDAKEDSKYIEAIGKKIKRSGVKSSRMVYPGDFLLTNSMSFGRPYILKTSGCIHDGWLVLSPKAKNIDTDYAYYCLGSGEIKAKLASKAAGAVVKNLNKDIVKDIEIPLPPLATQKHIARVLEQADQLHKQAQQMESELNQLAQSLFLEMFGDPIKNPKGWIKVPISHFVEEFEGGKSVAAAGGESAASKFRVLKISAVTWREFNPSESKPLPEEYQPEPSHFVRKGDLLFSRANTTELVGATSYVFEEYDNLLLPDKLWRFVWKIDVELSPMFIWNLFMDPSFRIELGKLSSGSGGSMKNISKGKLLPFEVIFPPSEMQKLFEKKFLKIRDEILACRKKTAECDAIFESLMQRAFNGELTTPELKAA